MKRKSLLIGMAALIFPLSMSAQYTIYPIPHQQTAGTGTVSFTSNVNVVCEDGIDSYTKQRIEQVFKDHGVSVSFGTKASTTESNVFVGVKGSKGIANTKAAELGLKNDVFNKTGKFDRHQLSLTNDGSGHAQLVVLGENSDAAFYAFASLEQMFDAGTSNLATVTINDYADLKERGIIEGFYGLPYSLDVRKDLLRYMMRYKMNTYVYGPKCDDYHSNHWKDPYPTSITAQQEEWGYMTQSKMKELCDVAHQTKVNFVWAIHPGNALMNSSTVVTDVMNKFESMYKLGVRQFAVFCDDVSIPSDDAGMKTTADRITALQRAIEKKWNVAGANPLDTVKALRFTPQIYCRSFAGSQDQFNRFFNALRTMPSNVTVYYTGGGVWSIPNDGDLNTVQNQFGRQVIWWWNYPCNDNGTGPSEIYPLDMKSNFVDMPNVGGGSLPSEITASNQGIICNPMAQGEVSKTAVFSAGDFGWNNKGFNNMASWEASIKSLFPGNTQATEAYRFLAPYLSKNDPASLNTLINSYKSKKDPTELNELMGNIVKYCDVLSQLENSEKDNERLMYKDIKPWVRRLHDMAQLTQSYLTSAQKENVSERWSNYMTDSKLSSTLSTNDDYMVERLSGFGGSNITTEPRLTHAAYRYLTPFASEYLKAHSVDDLFSKEVSSKAILFSNYEGAKATVASGATYSLNMPKTQNIPAGGYIGLELPTPTRMSGITVDKTLLNNSDFNVLLSSDGKVWYHVTADNMEMPEYVHYLAVKNVTDGERSLRIRTNTIKLTAAKVAEVESATAPSTTYWSGHSADLMADGKYNTYVCINQNQKVNDAYTLTLKETETIKNVRICMGTTHGDYAYKGNVQVSTDGNKWTTLKVAGTKSGTYAIDLPQNVVVGTESQFGTDIIATDFIPADGNGRPTKVKAKYVRFIITGLNGNKWLRLHEIEVNGEAINTESATQDANGIAIKTANDGDGTTSTQSYKLAPSSGGSIFYNLLNNHFVSSLVLFCDPETIDNLKFYTTLDGETWNEMLSDTQGGIITLAFGDANKNAKAVKIEWKGKTIPAIYEIVEKATEGDERPNVTRIENIAADGTAQAPIITLKNGVLSAQSAVGLKSIEAFSIDGRKVYSLSLQGEKQATLPVIATPKQVIVVKATLMNGSSQSFKVLK